MSEIKQTLGAVVTVTALGEDWRLTPLDQFAKGDIEEWMEARAWDLVNSARSRGLNEADIAAIRDQVTSRIEEGYYSFTGPFYQKILRRFDFLVFMTHLMLKPHHPDITIEKTKKLLLAEPEAFGAAAKKLHPDQKKTKKKPKRKKG